MLFPDNARALLLPGWFTKTSVTGDVLKMSFDTGTILNF
jgi:hypothetical protein